MKKPNSKPNALLLEDLPLPKQEELIDIIRQFRAVLAAHKMYPTGHQMITRSIERLYHFIQTLLQNSPMVVISSSNETFELNGEKLSRPVQERSFGHEIAVMLSRKGLETLVLTEQTHVQDLINFFSKLVNHGSEYGRPMPIDRLQPSMPSIQLNPTVIRRASSDKVRDRLSVEELVQSMDRDALLQELGLDPENLPPEVQEQLDQVQAKQEENEIRQRDPDQIIESLPEFVRSGHFVQELLSQSPYAERWPGIWSHQRPIEPQSSEFTEFPIQEEPPSSPSTSHEALQPYRSATDLPAQQNLSNIDWSAFKNRPVTEFPPNLQPQAIVRSDQFEELMRNGQFMEYLKTYFDQQKKLSQRLQLGDPEAVDDLNSPNSKIQIQETIDQLTLSLQAVPNTQTFDLLQKQISSQLTTMVPELFNQYLLKLTTNNTTQTRLRDTILGELSSEKLFESQEELIEKIEIGNIDDNPENAAQLLQSMVERQFQSGGLRDVNRAIQRLQSNSDSTVVSEPLQLGSQKVMSYLEQDNNLQTLLKQGAQRQGEDARQLLGQIATKSIEYCINEIFQQLESDKRTQRLELLIDVVRQAPPDKREAGLKPLLEKLNSSTSNPDEQVLLLELGRQYAPTEFEKQIVRGLTENQNPEQRTQLLRQAINHDSPRLRALFQTLAEKRTFSQSPEQEELILHYLHQNQTINAVELISQWIHEEDQSIGMKHSAIWMMGAFHTPEALAALGRLLRSSVPSDDDEKVPFYPEDVRFQALHALTRFNRTQIAPLLNQVKKDPSLLVRTYADGLLKDLDLDENALPPEYIQSAQTLMEQAPELFQNDHASKKGLLEQIKNIPFIKKWTRPKDSNPSN